MPFSLCSLSSGSKGNAILIRSGKTALLLDMGITFREFEKRISEAGIPMLDFQGLVISHSHTDHVKGADQFCKKTYAPVFAHEGAWQELDQKFTVPISQRRAFTGSFSVGDIDVHPFDTPHDAPHSKGFCFVCGREKISVVTDLGHMTREIFSRISDSDLVFLESNYDENMLRTGPYPPFLKARIAGPRGHLSNRDSGVVAAELAKRGVKKIVLGHISENNNYPQLAYSSCVQTLKSEYIEEGKDVAVSVAGQYSPTEVFEVETCST